MFFKRLFHKRNHLISDLDFDEKYKGVRELCIKQQLSLLFDNDYTYNRDDFINYLRNSGCSDIVVDGFIDCTASDINNSFMPKIRVLKVYDKNGKFIGLKKNR